MSASEGVATPAWRYDPGERKKATRKQRERGCSVYISVEELEAAGFSRDEPPPFYRVHGHKRSANAGSVIISLYRTP